MGNAHIAMIGTPERIYGHIKNMVKFDVKRNIAHILAESYGKKTKSMKGLGVA
jgi:hypothetical protein